MANKREFKKAVSTLCGAICNDMMMASCFIKDTDKAAIDGAIAEVLTACGKAVKESNTFFDKGEKDFDSRRDFALARKRFYADLFGRINNELTASINAALKTFNAAIPEEAKKLNKEGA